MADDKKPHFGDARQLVLTQALGASISHSISGLSTFAFALQPSFHYFVSANFSLGALLFVSHEADAVELGGVGEADTKRTNLGGGIEAGYNAELSKLVSIWLRGQLGASHLSTTYTAPSGLNLFPLFENSGGNGTFLFFGVYAPVLIHPVDHFFVGIGPSLGLHLGVANSASWSDVGLSSTVGGWI